MSTPLDMKELLKLHPWPAAFADESRLEWFRHFDLKGEPDALWRVMSDTSRLNRALGVSEMHFEERDGKRFGSSRNGGVRHEWVEVPWDWVAGQWLTSVRIYDRGFSKVVYAVQRLEKLATGSRAYIYFGAVPRGVIGRTALKIGFPTVMTAYAKVLPALADQLDRLRPEALMLPAPEMPADARA